MSASAKAKPNETEQQQPFFSADIYADPSEPVILSCAFWPLCDSDFHYSAEIKLEDVIQDFVSDLTIPGGTATREQKEDARSALRRIKEVITNAGNDLEEMKLRN